MVNSISSNIFVQGLFVILSHPKGYWSQLVSEHSFCYEESICNPDVWPGICQTGVRQSPIALPGDRVETYQSNYLRFNEGYSSSVFYLQNDGHTISLTFSPNYTSAGRMAGFGLRVPYIFAKLHFHWGDFKEPDIGSEHSIYGQFYPMEMHLVHYSTFYDSLSQAIESGDPEGVAVVAVFLEPAEEGLGREAEEFNKIARQIKSLYPFKMYREVYDLIDLEPLLPKPGDGCYQYHGSLTTPDCSEVVLWTVSSTRVIPIDPADFKRFSKVKDSDDLPLRNNFRPLKKSLDRVVKHFRVM